MIKDTADILVSQFAIPAYIVRLKDDIIVSVNNAGLSFASDAQIGKSFAMSVCGLGRSCNRCSGSLCSFILHKNYNLSVSDDDMVLSLWCPDDSVMSLYNEIDIEKGFSNFAYNLDSFLNVLRVYHDVGEEKICLITELYEKKDYTNLRIEVHGIKGTSYVIGAFSLGDRFKELEYACRDYLENADENALNILADNLFDSLENYSALVRELAVFSDDREKSERKELSDDEFAGMIKNALDKLDCFELEEAETYLAQLDQIALNDEKQLIAAKAVSEFRNFDYDKCSYYLKQLL